MAKPDMKLLSVQIPVAQYEAIRKWAKQRDSDVSKTVRQALREFCEVWEIPIKPAISNGIDPLAERLAKAGIGLEELG